MDQHNALEQLNAPISLKILNLASTLSPTNPSQKSPSKRYSLTNQETQTPASLAADLTHYRDLFSKLRFSYVEQCTKERFLKSITAQEPDFVSAAENAAFEEELKEKKAELKQTKEDVRGIISALEEQGRDLARRYEDVQIKTAQLETLPSEIEQLEATIVELRQKQEPASSDPEMAMPLQQTAQLLSEREQERQNMDLEIERLRAALPAKKAESQRLRDELAPIQMRKIKAVEEAQEAKKRREGGGAADELEEKGRWLRGVEASLRGMLEV